MSNQKNKEHFIILAVLCRSRNELAVAIVIPGLLGKLWIQFALGYNSKQEEILQSHWITSVLLDLTFSIKGM